jgi:heme exporter protein D
MDWHKLIHLDGYGPYVWASIVTTLALMAAEALIVARRWRRARGERP